MTADMIGLALILMGLITALSVPLIFGLGPYPVLALASVLMLGWLAAGVLYFGRQLTRRNLRRLSARKLSRSRLRSRQS